MQITTYTGILNSGQREESHGIAHRIVSHILSSALCSIKNRSFSAAVFCSENSTMPDYAAALKIHRLIASNQSGHSLISDRAHLRSLSTVGKYRKMRINGAENALESCPETKISAASKRDSKTRTIAQIREKTVFMNGTNRTVSQLTNRRRLKNISDIFNCCDYLNKRLCIIKKGVSGKGRSRSLNVILGKRTHKSSAYKGQYLGPDSAAGLHHHICFLFSEKYIHPFWKMRSIASSI